MYSVRTEGSFDAAHFLANYQGKCRNLHGHRWRVIIEVKSETLENGMVIDFTEIKKDLKDMLEQYDHSLIIEENTASEKLLEALNEDDYKINIVKFRPTAENFAHFFFSELKKKYNISKVKVYETPNNCAIYEE
ncbi:6-carboxytetrahydropterin synthase QueD [Lachnobacterium bovis]|jgi:6-pyruvoyltetrahydropterin/6-carboxytetrahydropterin synthase|uniref:6-carboxy-5,6,7,8-tetrahydropterin synthase n=1 Tax=Lachnobacterium bovis DSM 14045 TaxID=1122142 RepID=A0A1H3LS64_9FIRM|nr:6-carboxytetrahydropterin synthase QueD [Lachnobacterium bovis]MBQ1802494.1 6-carboxytetrahydropterin synthase QueD [Lachnobacterium sp.]SDY66818.1 6-pyruvoyltetrahydropterin/6-carboxytetrahydropterin synthase [Lachnobacterium bovis DSM 14045]